jgi:hypothetical protein
MSKRKSADDLGRADRKRQRAEKRRLEEQEDSSSSGSDDDGIESDEEISPDELSVRSRLCVLCV